MSFFFLEFPRLLGFLQNYIPSDSRYPTGCLLKYTYSYWGHRTVCLQMYITSNSGYRKVGLEMYIPSYTVNRTVCLQTYKPPHSGYFNLRSHSSEILESRQLVFGQTLEKQILSSSYAQRNNQYLTHSGSSQTKHFTIYDCSQTQ